MSILNQEYLGQMQIKTTDTNRVTYDTYLPVNTVTGQGLVLFRVCLVSPPVHDTSIAGQHLFAFQKGR